MINIGSVLNNAGLILTSGRELNIAGTGLVINNPETILGVGNQRNGTIYADSTAQNFTLNSSGFIDTRADNEGANFSA